MVGETENQDAAFARGERLLSAVERLVDGPEATFALVDRLGGQSAHVDHVADRIIAHYVRASAFIGGATAIPALIPGVGTGLTLLVGPLADMVALLKIEVEMTLALAAAHGHDIRKPRERQLAFLLAALETADLPADRSLLGETVDVVKTSIWGYAPRRISKLLLTVLAWMAAISLSKSLLRALPLIGIVVGASMNGVLTSRVGKRAHQALKLRGRLAASHVA